MAYRARTCFKGINALVLFVFVAAVLFALLPEAKHSAAAAFVRLRHTLGASAGIQTVPQQLLGKEARSTYDEQLRTQQGRLKEAELALKKVLAENARLAEEQRKQLGAKDSGAQNVAGGQQSAQECSEEVLREMKDLPIGAKLLQSYLNDHSKQLKERWQAQLSGQRQRGIVVPAGGDGTVPIYNAFVVLYVLRHHLKCSLPAVVMYWGASGLGPVDSISDSTKSFFQEHITDLEFVDGSALPYPAYHRRLTPRKKPGKHDLAFGGWKVKAFSLYAAPFQEVLLLDSDNLPLLDPSCLFDVHQYKEHGTLFWRDCCGGTFAFGSHKLFGLLDLKSPFKKEGALEMQTESGAFLFDRSRHWEVLEWVLFLNSHDDVVYKMTLGDKETYRLAFHLAGNPAGFQQVKHNVAYSLGQYRYRRSMIQLHPNGTAMFHHLSPAAKYMQHGDKPPRWPRYITARTSAYYGEYLARGMPITEDVAARVERSSCSYSLWDWPAAERSCVPQYNYLETGRQQKLPVFEVPEDSHLLGATAVADTAFKEFREAVAKRAARQQV